MRHIVRELIGLIAVYLNRSIKQLYARSLSFELTKLELVRSFNFNKFLILDISGAVIKYVVTHFYKGLNKLDVC